MWVEIKLCSVCTAARPTCPHGAGSIPILSMRMGGIGATPTRSLWEPHPGPIGNHTRVRLEPDLRNGPNILSYAKLNGSNNNEGNSYKHVHSYSLFAYIYVVSVGDAASGKPTAICTIRPIKSRTQSDLTLSVSRTPLRLCVLATVKRTPWRSLPVNEMNV